MPLRSATVQQPDLFRGILTPRQSQTLTLIAEGKSINEIAVLMGVSDNTVELHKRALRFKLRESAPAKGNWIYIDLVPDGYSIKSGSVGTGGKPKQKAFPTQAVALVALADLGVPKKSPRAAWIRPARGANGMRSFLSAHPKSSPDYRARAG
jgi:hypothetical protein